MTSKAQKATAHAAVKNAIKRGDLPYIGSQTCLDCGGRADDYHHESYEHNRWLSVIPLCRSCHRTRHLEADEGYMQHSRRKLTADQVKRLRLIADDVEALKKAAAHFRVSYTTVMSAARGYTYKWVA